MAQHTLFAVSGQGRGNSGEAARQAAEISQIQAFHNDFESAIETCSGKGMVYGPSEADADGDGCVHARSPCGDLGMLYGPNHPDADANGCLAISSDCGNRGMIFGPDHAMADGNGCVGGLEISDTGTPAVPNGLKLGDQSLCNADHEGVLRYNAAYKTVMFCDGEYWQEIGASPATSSTFNDISNAEPGETYTTGQAEVSGFFGERTVTATNGALLLVNGGLQGASATVVAGDRVQLRMDASSNFSTAKTTTMTMGSLVTTWTITTRTQDTTPNSFSFTGLTDQEPDTVVTSNSVTVSGFDGPLTASVSGQGSPELKVGSGSWGTSVAVEPGQSIQLRMTTSPDPSTAREAVVSLGSAVSAWSVATKAYVTLGSGACERGLDSRTCDYGQSTDEQCAAWAASLGFRVWNRRVGGSTCCAYSNGEDNITNNNCNNTWVFGVVNP